MNASYFLNDSYSLDRQSPRALVCVQTPTLLKDIEVGAGASVHRLPSLHSENSGNKLGPWQESCV